MKYKKYILLILSVFLLFFVTSSSVFAKEDKEDDKDRFSDLIDEDNAVANFIIDKFTEVFDIEYTPSEYMSKGEEVEEGGVELEIEKYPIERYMVNNEDTSGTFGFNLYSINNFFMGIIQNIVEVTDSALELFTLNELDSFADDLESISAKIYEVLKDNFAEMLFAFLCAYLVFIFFAKGNAKESFRKFTMFLIALFLAGYWTSNASFLMKSMNSISSDLQGTLVEAGNDLLGVFDDEREGVYAGVNNISDDEKIEGTTTVLRNIYFDLALKKPYLLINYGEADEEVINKNDDIKDLGFGFEEYPRSERMLAFDLTSNGSAYRNSYAHLETEKNNNSDVASGAAFKQSGLVFLTFFIVICLSIPFLLLGLINFALQLLAIFIAYFLPFAFILSFIPQFVMSGFKAIGNIVTIFLIKAMLGLLLLFIYLLTYSMNMFVKPESTGTYLLHVVLLIVIFFIVMIKRNKIISFVTAGRVQTVDGNIMPSMNNYYGNQFMNAKNRMNKKRSQKRESPNNYVGEEGELNQNTKDNRTPMQADRKVKANDNKAKNERTPQKQKDQKAMNRKNNGDQSANEKNIDKRKKDKENHVGNEGDELERTKQAKKEKDINSVNEKNDRRLNQEKDKDVNNVRNTSTRQPNQEKEVEIKRNKQLNNNDNEDVNSVKKEKRNYGEVNHDLNRQDHRKVQSVEEKKNEREEMI